MTRTIDVGPQTETDEEESGSFHVRFVWFATVLAGSVIWLRAIGSSFWLDELVTWWVVREGLTETVHRALTYQSQSPFYYVVAWATRHVGTSELVMRLPSLVAGLLAAFLLYRLARRWGDREFARIAVFTFVTWVGVGFAASEARPYAIGVLCAIGSTLLLERWLETGGIRAAIAYVAVAWLLVMSQYLFGLVLFAHVAYVTARVRDRTTRVGLSEIAVTFGALVISVLPLAGQLLSVWRNRGTLSVPWGGTVEGLATLIVPAGVGAAILLGGGLAAASGKVEIRPVPLRGSIFVLLFSWLLIPPMTLFAISSLTPIHVFSPRYALSAVPAGALLLAWGLRAVSPSAARRILVALIAILAVLTQTSALKGDEDWRGAIAATRSLTDDRTLVLLHPALVESGQLSLFEDPTWHSYLLAPISYYALDGDVVLLPYELTPPAESYVEDALDRDLGGVDRIVLVTRYPWVPYEAWLDGRLGAQGWASSPVGSYGAINVVEFTRA
jgi:Dolichyl-phosphate-mannose-protein mannosyltransferase